MRVSWRRRWRYRTDPSSPGRGRRRRRARRSPRGCPWWRRGTCRWLAASSTSPQTPHSASECISLGWSKRSINHTTCTFIHLNVDNFAFQFVNCFYDQFIFYEGWPSRQTGIKLTFLREWSWSWEGVQLFTISASVHVQGILLIYLNSWEVSPLVLGKLGSGVHLLGGRTFTCCKHFNCHVVYKNIYQTVNRLRSILSSCRPVILSPWHHDIMSTSYHPQFSTLLHNILTNNIRTSRSASQTIIHILSTLSTSSVTCNM